MNFDNEKTKNIYISIINNMSYEKKLRKVCELSDFTKMLYLKSLQEQNPDMNKIQIIKLYLKQVKECGNSNF